MVTIKIIDNIERALLSDNANTLGENMTITAANTHCIRGVSVMKTSSSRKKRFAPIKIVITDRVTNDGRVCRQLPVASSRMTKNQSKTISNNVKVGSQKVKVMGD